MSYCSKPLPRSIDDPLLASFAQVIATTFFSFLCLALPAKALADVNSAIQAMEDSRHPLLQFDTSRGNIFIELLPEEAPDNVANVLALVRGEKEIEDSNSGFVFTPNYYDGLRFHRVVPGFVVQTGAPINHPLGAPGDELLDEINADSLGLDQELVMLPGGEINPLLDVGSREAFEEQVLSYLLADMDVDSQAALRTQASRVYSRLATLTVKQLYELQGYRYRDDIITRPIQRGTVVLANSGPNRNGPEFFIALTDSPTLNGRYTVIGRVAEGMDTVDAIGATEVDPQRYSRLSTVIYTARQVNATTSNSLAAQ